MNQPPADFDDRPSAALARRPETAPLARYEEPREHEPLAVAVPRESGDTSVIARELARAQLKFPEIVKRRKADAGTKGSYSYANLADVCGPTLPILHEHGIVPTWRIAGDRVFLRLTHGESGQYFESDLQIVAPDKRGGIQALGSALSYVRRYLYVMMIGLVAIDDDDDGATAMIPEPLVVFLLDCPTREELVASMKRNREPLQVQAAALRLFDARQPGKAA